MLDRKLKRAWQQGLVLAQVSSLVACGSGRMQTCGSSPNAVLRSGSLKGQESGLIGGFIELENGEKCTAIVDVMKRTVEGDRFILNAWTSRHCLVEVNPANSASFELKIYGDGGYYETKAWPMDTLSVLDATGVLSGGSDHALKMGFGAFTEDRSIIQERGANQYAQTDCLEGSLDGTFCASVADTVVYSLGVSKRIKDASDERLYDLLALAFDKRQEVRDQAEDSSGVTRQSAAFSGLITDYWRTRAHLRLSPIVDFWMICSSSELRRSYSSMNGNWPLDMLRSSPSSSPSPWPVDVDVSPFWTSIPSEKLLEDCVDAPKLVEYFEWIELYRHMSGDSVWQELADLGLRDGDKPSATAAVFGFSKAMIERERELRQRIQSEWSILSRQLLSGGQAGPLFVHTNVLTAENDQADSVGIQLNAWQYANISLLSPVFSGLRSEIIATGARFLGGPNVSLSFRPGDSGSLFSFQGQFPLLTLNSVNGKGTSGGAAVTPLPRVTGRGSSNQDIEFEVGEGPSSEGDDEEGLRQDQSNSEQSSFGDRTSDSVPGSKTAQAGSVPESLCY